ncbi:MAG: hypothetical protein DLM69_11130 [Candidatus Chloroheliales bacterium]|nr:MAG: hypothetical protein DLM69_11130 [Chloroflexota bacterium]
MDTQIKTHPNGIGNKNNQASITGHLGNIESGDFRYTSNEQTGLTTAVLNLNVAVNPPRLEGTTRVPKAQWFDAVILGKLAEQVVEILQTGMLVTLSGHATYRSWPALKDGEPITYTDEKSGETKQAYQTAANLVVDRVCYTAADGLYYQVTEKFGEVIFTAVARPDKADSQKANIVLRGTATDIQLTPASETSDARLNFVLNESYIRWSGAAAVRRHRVTMWGDPAVLAHAEMQEGDQVTVLGALSPNSYTDRLGIYQQTFNITARVLDNYGQKQAAKPGALQSEQQRADSALVMPASKASTPKAATALVPFTNLANQ